MYWKKIDISILNQFDEPLTNYKGTAVREDGHWIGWMKEDDVYEDNIADIVREDIPGASSTYPFIAGHPELGHRVDTHAVERPPWNVGGFVNGTKTDEKITVEIAGWEVVNGMVREMTVTENTSPPLPPDAWQVTPPLIGYVPPRLFMRFKWK